MGMPMGQAFSQVLHILQISPLMRSRFLPPPMAFCMVPMGQKEHQMRGWTMTPRTMAIAVVTTHITQKTYPQCCQLPGFCMMRKDMNPMSRAKMGQRNFMVRTNAGTVLTGEIFERMRSKKLPRGHMWPQTQRPLNRLPMIPASMVSGTKNPKIGYFQPSPIVMMVMGARIH